MRRTRKYPAWLLAALCWHAAPAAADQPSSADAERARIDYIQKALKGTTAPVPGRRMLSAGTGFFVAPQRILTNQHVIASCAAITVRGADGRTLPAEVVADEKSHDLALMKSDAAPAAVAAFRPADTAQAGERVAALGYPDQGLPRIEPFLTVGTLAAADRAGQPSRLAVRADIRAGNSGGPLLDTRGHVIGVVNAKVDTVRVYQNTGQSVANVGFAIATGPVLEFLRRNGVVPTQAAPAPDLGTGDDLLAKARQFTVRVGCWQ